MNDEENTQSDWNEQIMFSKLYFHIGYVCRLYQSKRDYLNWKNNVDAKISHVIPICEKDEKIKLRESKEMLNTLLNKYLVLQNKKNSKRKAQALYTLDKYLFETESIIDEYANNHMPFLKINKRIDIEGL